MPPESRRQNRCHPVAGRFPARHFSARFSRRRKAHPLPPCPPGFFFPASIFPALFAIWTAWGPLAIVALHSACPSGFGFGYGSGFRKAAPGFRSGFSETAFLYPLHIFEERTREQ